jgi:hypothetical protein
MVEKLLKVLLLLWKGAVKLKQKCEPITAKIYTNQHKTKTNVEVFQHTFTVFWYRVRVLSAENATSSA